SFLPTRSPPAQTIEPNSLLLSPREEEKADDHGDFNGSNASEELPQTSDRYSSPLVHSQPNWPTLSKHQGHWQKDGGQQMIRELLLQEISLEEPSEVKGGQHDLRARYIRANAMSPPDEVDQNEDSRRDGENVDQGPWPEPCEQDSRPQVERSTAGQ